MKKTNNHTLPRLVKGKKPTMIPRGSTLEKEWAKNKWYINYSYNGKQYRTKGEMNRKKDHKEKAFEAEVLLEIIKNDLKNGYNPENPMDYVENLIQSYITINDSVNRYLGEISSYCRPKTVQSYQSKLRYLVESFPNKPVNSFTSEDLEKYISDRIKQSPKAQIFVNDRYIVLNKEINWTQNTVRSAKGIFRAFFNWCISKKYYTNENPVSKIEARKIRSEVESSPRNIPFTVEDNKLIMIYLDENDKLAAFFCRFIYYTCIRPGELSKLKVKDLDMENRQITIPMNISKNTKRTTPEVIKIVPELYKELEALSIADFPKNYFVCSNAQSIIGETTLGNNIPYKRFKKALKNLGLINKGYNLYSFKHFSNIMRYNSGWKLTEIMKVNRHSSITMTEKYLRNINRDIDLSDKPVPKI
jgi:integrase